MRPLLTKGKNFRAIYVKGEIAKLKALSEAIAILKDEISRLPEVVKARGLCFAEGIE